jgi:uncharacterized integral membrane protein
VSEPGPARGRRVSASLVAGVVLAVLLVVFIFENTARTRIRFIVPEAEAPLWVALFIAVLFGAVIGALFTLHRQR